jgi:outer membrane protein OmpA-like peptidoglycan-associated protein
MTKAMDAIFGRARHMHCPRDGGEHWLSVSDLMAGLMMVFMFVSIALMRDAMIERDMIRDVAVTYQENQVALYQALVDEFEHDLDRWDADIDRDTLSFEFKSPDVLFDTGQITIKPAFRVILDDFFPRYLDVLLAFRDSIEEVRIEGHTSSVWNQNTSEEAAYFKNMELSQGRTRGVLGYVYELEKVASERPWIKRHVAAVGFSSSRVVLNTDGSEDRSRSRRVSFRVITNAETQIRTILER